MMIFSPASNFSLVVHDASLFRCESVSPCSSGMERSELDTSCSAWFDDAARNLRNVVRSSDQQTLFSVARTVADRGWRKTMESSPKEPCGPAVATTP